MDIGTPQTRGIDTRADQPLVTSDEYNEAIDRCDAEHEARQKRKPSNYALSMSFLEPRLWACLFALLVALLILGWIGMEVPEAASSLLASVGASQQNDSRQVQQTRKANG